jgi:hypothetical protein
MDATELLSVSGGCLVDKEVGFVDAAFSAKVDCTAIAGGQWNHSEHLRLGCAIWGSTGAIVGLLIMCFYRTVLLPGRSVQQHLDGLMRHNRLCRRVREAVCVI